MSFSQFVAVFWQDIAGWLLLLEFALAGGTLVAVLHLKREPMSAIAWALTVILLPIFGPILFLLFGYQTIPRKLRKRQQRGQAYKKFVARVEGESAEVPPPWAVLARIAQHEDGFPVTRGNAVEFYHEGTEAFEAMLAAIERAKHHVHAQFFICRADATGRRFLEALRRCARRKVEVRLLVDSVGSYNLSSRVLKELQRDGGQTASFLPILNPLRVNLRNHRKILVVDYSRLLAGGMNIGAEYLGPQPDPNRWTDLAFVLEGPTVWSWDEVFCRDWEFASGQTPFLPPEDVQRPQAVGDAVVQFVPSGPDVEGDPFYDAVLTMIYAAKKRLWAVTPYFVPDESLAQALTLAARRGVDVRILLPRHSNHRLPDLVRGIALRQIQSAGGKILFYTRGMMHAKALLKDDDIAVLGSANLDIRSLIYNYESAMFVYSQPEIRQIEAWMEQLATQCQCGIDPAGLARSLAEGIARLAAPLL